MKTIRFGTIGCGMMGREFASAADAGVLDGMAARPEIVAVCNRSPGPFDWFRQNFPAIKQFTSDYKELLANPEVEASISRAAPLASGGYCAAIRAGKHLLGENRLGLICGQRAILACLRQYPKVFARCTRSFRSFRRRNGLAT